MNGQRESIGKVNSRLAVANPSKLDSSKLKEAHDAVAMLELLHFAPEWRDFQFVPMGVPKGETSARREELGQIDRLIKGERADAASGRRHYGRSLGELGWRGWWRRSSDRRGRYRPHWLQ